jgi:hypothetical protein
MVLGPVGKFLAPIGITFVLISAVETALAFIFILLTLTGDFPNRIIALTTATALPLAIGGAALAWLGK